jgi:hypothetical protein
MPPTMYIESFKIAIGFKREATVAGVAKLVSIRYYWFEDRLQLKNIKIYFTLNFDNLQRGRMYTIDKDWNFTLAGE